MKHKNYNRRRIRVTVVNPSRTSSRVRSFTYRRDAIKFARSHKEIQRSGPDYICTTGGGE